MIQKAIQQTQLSVKEVCHSIQAKVESDLKCTSQVCSFKGIEPDADDDQNNEVKMGSCGRRVIKSHMDHTKFSVFFCHLHCLTCQAHALLHQSFMEWLIYTYTCSHLEFL